MSAFQQAPLEVAASNTNFQDLPYQVLLDHSLPSCSALASRDGRFIFVAGPQLSVKVFSANPVAYVSSLLPPQSSVKPGGTEGNSKIVALLRHPHQTSCVVVVCSHGLVYVSDQRDGRVVEEYHLGVSIIFAELRMSRASETDGTERKALGSYQVVVVTSKAGEGRKRPDLSKITAKERQKLKQAAGTHKAIGGEVRSSVNSIIYVFELGAASARGRCWYKTRICKTRKASGLAVSSCGTWIGVVSGPRIIISRLLSLDGGPLTAPQVVRFRAPDTLTCIAFPPIIGGQPIAVFATGSQKGPIALWHALSPSAWVSLHQSHVQDPTRPPDCETTILHWHASAVNTISFTSNAAYLASGGSESVLVLWQMESAEGHGAREFLPRLGGAIRHITNTVIADVGPVLLVTRTDGDVIVVDAGTMRVRNVLVGSRRIAPISRGEPMPLAVLPGASCPTFLVLSSHPSVLQQITPSSSSTPLEIEISPSNRIHSADHAVTEDAAIAMVAFSGHRSEYMATIDTRVLQVTEVSRMVSLKFWERSGNACFRLQARVDGFHIGKVTSLSSPTLSSPVFATTSSDGSIKVWLLSSAGAIGAASWQCAHSFQYHGYPALGSAFSNDGTILAIVHGSCVSLWETNTFSLVQVLTAGCGSLGCNRRVAFGGPASRRLIVAGSKATAVFDLLTGSQLAVWPIAPHSIVTTLTDCRFILVAESFGSKSSQDNVYVADLQGNPTLHEAGRLPRCRAASWASLPHASSSPVSGLLFLTQAGSLGWVGGCDSRAARHVDAGNGPTDSTVVDPSPWAAITGATNMLPSGRAEPSAKQWDIPSKQINMLDIPAHVVPSLHTLFSGLLSLTEVTHHDYHRRIA